MHHGKTIGILGMGSFGRFLAELLVHHSRSDILVFDPRSTHSVGGVSYAANLNDLVTKADILVLSVPLASYDEVLPHIQRYVRPQTLIIDICSVKLKAEERLRMHLPAHNNILCTHPLFGPQSAAYNDARGHTLIVTDSPGDLAHETEDFCSQQLGLQLVHMSADEHDKVMAQVHALTFFVAHGLREMNLPTPPFMTPSYKELIDLVELDKKHSPELYDTIQNGNPHAKQVRQTLMDTFQRLNQADTAR